MNGPVFRSSPVSPRFHCAHEGCAGLTPRVFHRPENSFLSDFHFLTKRNDISEFCQQVKCLLRAMSDTRPTHRDPEQDTDTSSPQSGASRLGRLRPQVSWHPQFKCIHPQVCCHGITHILCVQTHAHPYTPAHTRSHSRSTCTAQPS